MSSKTAGCSIECYARRAFCRRVLRAVLGIEAGEISYLNAEQCFEPLATGRGVRLDVLARGEGRVYDIEMQVAKERDLGRRMRYYQAAMDVGELGSGEGFADLPESYVLVLLPLRRLRQGRPGVRDRAAMRRTSRSRRARRLALGGGAERVVLGGRPRCRSARCATISLELGTPEGRCRRRSMPWWMHSIKIESG